MKLWVQKWEESEAGWGTRPDGYSLHKNREDIAKFLDDIRQREEKLYGTGVVPSEYSRPCGTPYLAEVEEDNLKERIDDSSHGVWGENGNRYPEPIDPSDGKDGWVVR